MNLLLLDGWKEERIVNQLGRVRRVGYIFHACKRRGPETKYPGHDLVTNEGRKAESCKEEETRAPCSFRELSENASEQSSYGSSYRSASREGGERDGSSATGWERLCENSERGWDDGSASDALDASKNVQGDLILREP